MSTDDADAKNDAADSDAAGAVDSGAAADDKAVQLGKAADEVSAGSTAADTEAAASAEPKPAEPKPAEPKPADDLAKGARPPATTNRAGLVPIVAAFVAGVLLVAAVTALVVFYRQADDRKGQLDAHAEATRAACEYGKLISTYDPQTIDDYLKKVDAASTGDWKDQFAKLGQDLKGVVIDAKAQSSTYDMQCGFQSGDKDNANVLVVIGQTTTNVNITAAGKQPSKVELVVVAGLKKVGDKWLVDKFDLPILKQMGN